VKGNALILAHPGAVPPAHRIEMKLGPSGQPPTQFMIADFPTSAVVREDRIADKSDDRMLALPAGWPGGRKICRPSRTEFMRLPQKLTYGQRFPPHNRRTSVLNPPNGANGHTDVSTSVAFGLPYTDDGPCRKAGLHERATIWA
jgi:hypothetical protein